MAQFVVISTDTMQPRTCYQVEYRGHDGRWSSGHYGIDSYARALEIAGTVARLHDGARIVDNVPADRRTSKPTRAAFEASW